VIFPGAAALGASFPLLISVARGDSGGLPRSTGLISASSTAGAIVGALGAGLFVLPQLGFERTLAAVCGLLAALAWGAHLAAGRCSLRAAWPAACASIAAVALALHPLRPEALLDSSVVDRAHPGEELFFRVGRAATVQAQARPEGILLRSDGLPEAMIARRGAPPSLDDQQWLGALGPMARPEARSMLVVGLGGGVALEAVPAALGRIDVVEIEPRIVEANRALAAVRRADPLADPRVRVVLNDARNALLRSGMRYDVIVSQPSHPWTATSATLYSREFISLAKSRLAAQGVFVQWMNTAFLDEALFRALLATLRAEFRHVRAYEPVPRAFLLLAADAPLHPERWFGSPASDPGSRQRLASAGLGGPEDLRWSLVLDERGVDAIAAGAAPLTDDRNPLTVRSRPSGGMDERRLDALVSGNDALAAAADDPARGEAAYLAQRVLQVRPSRLARAPALAARATLESADFESAAREIAALADGSASAEARAAASRLESSAAAVIAAWREGRQGRTAAIGALDADLAAARRTDPWSATAARLRAEWRLAAALAMSADDPQRAVHLRDALAIVEEALATGVTTDLLFLRARLSVSQDQLVESAAAFATELGRRVDDSSIRPAASSPLQMQRLEALRQALVRSGSQRAQEVRGDIDRLALRLQGR
jgi:spermidine synthase